MEKTGRNLPDFLTAYLEYTDRTEPPISYHTWVGLGIIAGALQRKVYLRWGFETLYPNFYIVLVGPSGRCRKGMAMKLGRNILSPVGINLTSESVTREALIRRMNNSSTSYFDERGAAKFHCSLTCMSPELSVFLGKGETRFLADLTDWYDCADKWTYETKNSGTDAIEGVCFNLIGATAADWLQVVLPQEAIGGGFTSRVIFVVEENKRQIIAEDARSARQDELEPLLISDLERISTLVGEFQFSPSAADMYRTWYTQQEERAANNQFAISDPKFAGYCDRRATHARKLSMLLSASRDNSLVIEKNDFARALQLLGQVEVHMPKVFGGIGSSQYSVVTDKMLSFIRGNPHATRSSAMKRFYRDIDPDGLRIVEATLVQMQAISVEELPQERDARYRYVGQE